MDKTDIKKKIIIAGLLASFLTPFVRASVNVALPTMAIDLNLSAIFLTWLPTLYLLVTAILYVPFGRLGDLYGRKRIFQYGLIIFTVSSFLSAFSISGEMLLAIRIFQSIGHAMIFANLYAIITSAFPENERGGVLGLISIGVFGGLIFGPIIGGLLTQLVGWRFLFIWIHSLE
jgi:MFS family permease